MRLYFDTNVYSFIKARQELTQVAEFLKAHKCVLVASTANLFEVYAIRSRPHQQEELRVLLSLAHEFERRPPSWLHALEVRREIQKLRPHWLRKIPSLGKQRRLLKTCRASWLQAKLGNLPPPQAYAAYERDFEAGVATSRAQQKEIRAALLDRQSNFSLLSPDDSVAQIDISDPETYWRAEGLQAWYNAVENKIAASRDYLDWLGPYLRRGSFRDASYRAFWLSEVSGEAMPLNRLVGLVSFYQLGRKISHGNAGDQLHAGHWLSSDLFVTADRAFYQVLAQIARMHFRDHPPPALVNRSATSFVGQLEPIVRNHP